MKREVVDYLVRVIVPLGFILVVAYLAAYIPRREFNATIAIQVTAVGDRALFRLEPAQFRRRHAVRQDLRQRLCHRLLDDLAFDFRNP